MGNYAIRNRLAAENINPVYFLSPLAPIIFSFVLIFYWRARRSFRWVVLIYALLAYGFAIIAKSIFQALTAAYIIGSFGSASIITGLYYGLQTSFLEVGLAYIVARYALRREIFVESDAESYGLSLSFWENGVLLGIFSLVSILSTYLAIAYGGPAVSQTISNEIMKAQPSLFSSTISALPSIGFSILERTSSLLAHFAWGFLVIVSITRKKPVYFFTALPMGLMDALVPFAGTLGIPIFEATVFLLSLLFLSIALYVRKAEGVPGRALGVSHDRVP